MKEKKTTIIVIAVAALVLIGAFVVSAIINKNYLEEVNYVEFQELVKKEGKINVYVGDLTDVKTSLNNIGKDKDETIYYLNSTYLTDEQLEELGYKNDKFSIYENGEIKEEKNINLTEVNVNEYLKTIKQKGNHFMFIGSATCGYCTKFKQEIRKAQVLYNFDVYYLDLSTLDEEEYSKLYESNEYFTTEEWGTPLNFLYKDGKQIGILNGYVPADNLIEFLKSYGVINE